MDHRLEKLRIGTRYVAQIRSINEDQTSEWSPAFYINTPTDSTIPGNVTGLSGSYSGGSFRWTWLKPIYNTNGKPFKDFSYYEITVSDGTNSYTDRTTSRDYFIDVSTYQTKLGNGPTLTLSVKAADWSDNKSVTPASSAVTAPVPSTISGSSTISGVASVRLTWTEVTNVAVDEYEVFVDDTVGFTADTSTFTNLSGRTNDASFIWQSGETTALTRYFKIRARSVYGVYGSFQEVAGTTLAVGAGGGGSSATYDSVISTYSPLGNWKLDETTGTTATDTGSNADNGTYTGTYTLGGAALATGLGASVNLSSDYVDITSSDYQALTSAWTVMGWVKLSSSTDHVLVSHAYNGSNVPFVLGSLSQFATSGKAGCGFYNGSWRGVSGTTTLSLGTVYHIAGTWDGTYLKIYVDGNLENTSAPGSSPSSSTGTHVYIGKRWDTSSPEFMNGDVSNVSIFGSALTASNILEIYNTGVGAGGGGGAGPSIQRETWSYQGTVATIAGGQRLYVEQPSTILSCRASVGTAPTGNSIKVDVNKNGTTIFTTQANRPTIAIAGNTSGAVTNMNISSLSAGDYLTVDVDQVGSTVAGADLTVTVTLETV
jgi:hypothetical protein